MHDIKYPYNNSEILRNKKRLKQQLSTQVELLEKRIAILSGSTVGDIKDILEIFLLSFKIQPRFYIGQYNRFYEEILFDNQELVDFKPELIYIHTSTRNLSDDAMFDKLQAVWLKIKNDFACPIIQNNFELPGCGSEFENYKINKLNIQVADYAKQNSDFYVNDIQHLSACFGVDEWFSERDFVLYKYFISVKATPTLCYNIAKIIKSLYGKNKKCLVLDLDNTLWGGIVGDVGTMGIEVGGETVRGETFLAFQKYVKSLHDNGVILVVCSKNDEFIAKSAFNNPNMHLRLEDFAVFCANWDSKAENITKIAKQLNILTESIVFIDDNPAERELIRQTLPEVEVPDVNTPMDFVKHIERAGYFCITNISGDDKKRNEYYMANAKRNKIKESFVNYGEYLKSLKMSAEIYPFSSVHLERITQLINKTNQFNLTARRYSHSEIGEIASDSQFITLYATLDDKFGHNGIVSALIGEILGNSLHIRLWVMSCRVFKRDLELAIFDQLVGISRKKNINKIIGYYFKTEKNGYVSNLFNNLGFVTLEGNVWQFDLVNTYQPKNKYIQIKGEGK